MSATLNRRTILSAALGGVATLSLPARALALAGPATGTIALNANENPYGPSSSAMKAAQQATEKGAYYSFGLQGELRTAIAARHRISEENVVLSTGSNEALCATSAAWGKQGHIIAPALTYSPHLAYAKKLGVQVETVALADDMSIDLAAMAAAVSDETAMVYVCNPNNPTGLAIDGDELREFCRRVCKRATVLVDEAYNDLAENPSYTSMMDLVREGQNIVVAKTFSKVHGLAGMRVGYTLGRADLIAKVRSHVMSWPNSVGTAAALASYKDHPFLRFSKQKITEGKRIVNDTYARHGITSLASSTNFIYADIGRDASVFAQRMSDRGIMIRRAYEPYTNWSRVSMGKIEDLQAFSDAFDDIY